MSTYILVSKEEANNVLIHSSGAWKNHKYIRKEGNRYIYHETVGEPKKLGNKVKTVEEVKEAAKEKKKEDIEWARKTIKNKNAKNNHPDEYRAMRMAGSRWDISGEDGKRKVTTKEEAGLGDRKGKKVKVKKHK